MRPAQGELPRVIQMVLDGVRTGDWTRIDEAWNRVRVPRGIHHRRDTGLDGHRFLRCALVIAHDGDFLDGFVQELSACEALDHRLAKDVIEQLGRPGWNQEAFQNGVYLMRDAVIASDNQRAACDYVCRIDIDGQHSGTGVLVRPDLVATAAHVIWELVEKRQDDSPALTAYGAPRTKDGSNGSISVTFGYANLRAEGDNRKVYRHEGEVVPVARDWLTWASPPADADRGRCLDVTDVSGISEVNGPWDVALIKLAVPWGKDTARLLDVDPPENPFEVQLLHHPNGNSEKGQPLVISGGQLYRHLPGWPPVRCLHSAATSPGSSGAPVFNRSWHVVALHQGGARPGSNGGGHNRAVPVRPWLARIDTAERLGPVSVPRLAWLKATPDLMSHPYPVIGRTETQRRIYQALQPDATAQQRVLIVRGEPGTGLRFTRRLVREIVTAHGDGVVAELDAANAPQGPVPVVNWIANALSAGLPESGRPSLETGSRALRGDLVPALGQRLEELAATGRSIWLVLDGPGDAPGGIPPAVSGVVSEFISQLGDYPAVRLVLTGWTQTPHGFEESVEYLRPPTAEDVAGHLFSAGGEPDAKIMLVVDELFGDAVRRNNGIADYPTARKLADVLRPLVAEIVRANLGGEADDDRPGA